MRRIISIVPLLSLVFSVAAADGVSTDMSSAIPETIRDNQLKERHKVVMIGNSDEPTASQDSIDSLINMFYVDQFRHFQDPLAPYFLMMSKDATLAMGVGGAVRMRGWSDFEGAIDANGFSPYLIPVPSSNEHRRRLGGTPGGTSIFMRVIGRNSIVKNFNAYIQCDFSGTGNVGFKLKKAYVTMQDWTVGYASSTFSDPAAEAPTIDGAGPNGKSSRTAMLIRWMHTFKHGLSMAASLEMPSSQVDAEGTKVKRLDDWLPDVVAYGQYEWSDQQHVRIAGMLRTLPYRDLVSRCSRSEMGWSVQLSSIIRPVNPLAIYVEANTGQGYSSRVNDLSIGNYDLLESTTPGRMYAPYALGVAAGLKYNFRHNIYACAVYGYARYFSKYTPKPTDYRYGNYYAVNLFWDVTPRIQTGIECLHGDRHNFNHQCGDANRVDFLFQFSF